jgi:hypothetical protein
MTTRWWSGTGSCSKPIVVADFVAAAVVVEAAEIVQAKTSCRASPKLAT